MYSFLEKCGYNLIFKPTVIGSDGKLKGNVDGELILHTMIEYQNFDKAIIVSGDGDFYCLVEYLEKNDKLFQLLIPNPQFYSRLLKKFGDKIDFISTAKNILEYKKSR